MSVAGTTRQDARRNASRGGFIAVPLEVARLPELGDGAFRTYTVLRHYCFGRRSYCWPSIRTLARDRSCSEETIRRHLRELSAAGLVRVEKRGRGNMYRFPDEHLFWPTETPKRQEARAVKETVLESERPTPHGFVGQGFTREKTHTPPLHDVESRSKEEPPSDQATRALIAHGVSPGTAKKLAASHGEALCWEAVKAMEVCRSGGAHIHNPGGWLYRAITQGFVRMADLPENTNRFSAPIDTQIDEKEHLERLKERRKRALKAQGIEEEADVLWQKVNDRLRAGGRWTPVLAAACLRQVDDTNYAIQCRAPKLSASLSDLLPVIREVIHDEVQGAPAVTLLTAAETW